MPHHCEDLILADGIWCPLFYEAGSSRFVKLGTWEIIDSTIIMECKCHFCDLSTFHIFIVFLKREMDVLLNAKASAHSMFSLSICEALTMLLRMVVVGGHLPVLEGAGHGALLGGGPGVVGSIEKDGRYQDRKGEVRRPT